MSANKDPRTGKWISQFYYTQWGGERKKKYRRGFATKRDALEWEREFLLTSQASPQMSFSSFVELYLEDMGHRLRANTIRNKKYIIDQKILPYFGSLPLCEIKPPQIRQWQNEMTAYRDSEGKAFSQTYLRSIQNQLSAIFNYGVRYYDLRENPCLKAGSLGKGKAEEMQFWTQEEFLRFLEAVKDKPKSHAAFLTLYYTGMRLGEMLALAPEDFDWEAKTVHIRKSYQRFDKTDWITPPKTPKSNRVITLPPFLCAHIRQYARDVAPGQRLFPFTKHYLTHELDRGCRISKVKKIRTHDLRHSHASLLIEMGFGPLLIAERLGHEKVETTLNIYSHLYPNKQTQVAQKLEERFQKIEAK